jgi:hypothetical protein
VHIDCCTLDDSWAKLHSIYNLVLNLYSLQYNWDTIYKNYSEYFQTNFRALATIYIRCTHFISHLKQIQYTTTDNISTDDMAFCLFGFILQLSHPAWNLQTEIDWPECAFHSLHARYIRREVTKLLSGVLAWDHSKRSDKCNYSKFVPELLVIQYVYSLSITSWIWC